MKATNLLGHKNQFLINDWDAYYFQSYDTMICKVVQGDLVMLAVTVTYKNHMGETETFTCVAPLN